MTRNTDSRRVRSRFPALSPSHFRTLSAGLCVGLLAGACNAPPGVNPWRDDSISPAAWSTPSEQGILAAGHEPVLRHRDVPPAQVPLVADGVPHYPLWFEDPFEDKGDEDGRFALTWVDYLAMPYSYARAHLNMMGWPASAVILPPWVAMVSDGEVGPGPDHDATRGESADPCAGPADFAANEEPETPGDSAAPEEPPATGPGT